MKCLYFFLVPLFWEPVHSSLGKLLWTWSTGFFFFFLWNPLVGAYCFYKTDLSYFTQWAFIKRNIQLLTMKILVKKSLLTITVRPGAKLLEFFLFSSAVIKKLPCFPKYFCLALYFPASLNRGRESHRWLKTAPCYKCRLPCISDEENTSGTCIGNGAFTQKS